MRTTHFGFWLAKFSLLRYRIRWATQVQSWIKTGLTITGTAIQVYWLPVSSLIANPPIPARVAYVEVSVVLPVYNSASTLHTLVGSIVAALDSAGFKYELILVNDGSCDSSWKAILELARLTPAVVPIDLSRNYGEHNATLCGIRRARYPITLTLDDDLQNPPEEILRLIHKLEEGFDVVYGSPRKEQHGLFRDLASLITKRVMRRTMGIDCASSISSFRAFRTRLREAFTAVEGEFVNIDVLLSWGAAKYGTVKVKHYPRFEGSSSYNLERLIRHAVNMITGYSTLPLQIATLNGMACLAVCVVLLGYSVVNWIVHRHIVFNLPFFAAIVTGFLGAQLIAIGIIGEYLGRMNSSAMKRPPYMIKTIGSAGEEDFGVDSLKIHETSDSALSIMTGPSSESFVKSGATP